jgi:proliferating cell nuclear antigen
MLEALIAEGGMFKRLMDSIKDLITDVNFECKSEGIYAQAMDSSHVSLVALEMKHSGFEHYRTDRTTTLGVNMGSMLKILKCAGNDDAITLKAEDGADHVNFMFESRKQTRISHFKLKLVDIDTENLGIPPTDYKVSFKMPAIEFHRIVRELQSLGDTCTIAVNKEGVKFHVNGDTGSGTIVLKSSYPVKLSSSSSSSSSSSKSKKKTLIGEDDDDKSNKSKMTDTPLDDDNPVQIMRRDEDIALTFALRYLNSFAKATPLAEAVILRMSSDVPLVVEYVITTSEDRDFGTLKFYLAPKIEEERNDEDIKNDDKEENTDTKKTKRKHDDDTDDTNSKPPPVKKKKPNTDDDDDEGTNKKTEQVAKKKKASDDD